MAGEEWECSAQTGGHQWAENLCKFLVGLAQLPKRQTKNVEHNQNQKASYIIKNRIIQKEDTGTGTS